MEILAQSISKVPKIVKRKSKPFTSFFLFYFFNYLEPVAIKSTPKKVHTTPLDELVTIKK